MKAKIDTVRLANMLLATEMDRDVRNMLIAGLASEFVDANDDFDRGEFFAACRVERCCAGCSSCKEIDHLVDAA